MAELPRIKVCGLTREGDLRAAIEAGADALGFVRHAASPRHLEVERAAQLVDLVPPGLTTVAVVVDARPDELRAHLDATGIGWAQLCGDEDPAEWAGFDAPLLRRLGVDGSAPEEAARWRDVAAGFVLDHASAPGGSGKTVDVQVAARLAAQVPCLLAGGLGPDNVRERTLAVTPRGVDASSRLESSPGVKDPAAVRDFVRAARAALEDIDA